MEYGGFLSHRATPLIIHFYRFFSWIFAWHKPSSCWGSPMETPLIQGSDRQLCIRNRPSLYWPWPVELDTPKQWRAKTSWWFPFLYIIYFSIHLFIHSFIHSFIYFIMYWFIYSFIYLLIYSLLSVVVVTRFLLASNRQAPIKSRRVLTSIRRNANCTSPRGSKSSLNDSTTQ